MTPKIEITGNINKVSSYILWAKQQWSLREGRWFKHVGECLIEFFRAGDSGYIRLVADSSRGFITHPRSGTVRGFQFPGHDSSRIFTYGLAHTGKGYHVSQDGLIDEGDSTGAQEGQPYPLIDDDATDKHWLFEKVEDEWGADGPQELVYGNIDWKGPVTENSEDRLILTYKGNPSRYWPVGQFLEIPGLSTVDHFVDGTLNSYEYMTVFGDKVYEGGEVLYTMPQLYHPLNTTLGGWEASHQNAQVLGAAYRAADNQLFCMVKTCYNTYPRLKGAAGSDDFEVSAWHVFKDGVVVQDWLDDEAGARSFVASNTGYTVVEITDPGRGYFVELIAEKAGNIPGGWTRILRIATPAMCDVNWFFSEDGTKACSVMFGELHIITIDGDTATHTTTPLGGFKNTISFSSQLDQESNQGTPDPELAGGIFSNIYRVGVEVGDWINKDEVTQKYTSNKSGKTILAADYKGNELVKMEANIAGNETYDYFRRYGKQWGKIATMPYYADRWAPDKRIPGVSIVADPFTAHDNGHPTWHMAVQVSGACKPIVSVQGLSVTPYPDNPLEFTFPCSIITGTVVVVVTVTDEVTGLVSEPFIRTYTNVTTPGTWVSVADGDILDKNGNPYYGCNIGYGPDEIVGNTKYLTIWFYNEATCNCTSNCFCGGAGPFTATLGFGPFEYIASDTYNCWRVSTYRYRKQEWHCS